MHIDILQKNVRNSTIHKQMKLCQQKLHNWGEANQVSFDAQKEKFCIISLDAPEGDSFKLLGVLFDTRLKMTEAIHTLRAQANWKLRALLQTRRNFTIPELMNLFKSRILGFIEYRTPAIYHADSTTLAQLDKILGRLLRTVGISDEESLLHFRLAPLNTRRDMGMLGVIHRSVLGEGPQQFSKYFVRQSLSVRPGGREAARKHDRQLVSQRVGKFLDVLSHSVLGLVDVYNLLPQHVVNAPTVSNFQKRLQTLLMEMASTGEAGWKQLYCPRKTLWNNPLRKMPDWCPIMRFEDHHEDSTTYLGPNEDADLRLFAFKDM